MTTIANTQSEISYLRVRLANALDDQDPGIEAEAPPEVLSNIDALQTWLAECHLKVEPSQTHDQITKCIAVIDSWIDSKHSAADQAASHAANLSSLLGEQQQRLVGAPKAKSTGAVCGF